MTVTILLSMMGAALAGAIAHELAHWMVWKLAGRKPVIDFWGLEVRPRAGTRAVTGPDRIAAAAPYVMGLAAVVSGVLWASVIWVVFGLAAFQIPSRVDVETIRGNVEWAIR